MPELCNKTSELSPYSILLNCLQRNFGLNGANIDSRLVTQKNQKNEFVMSVGKHTVQVQCKNKKDGKQRASQAILQVRKVKMLLLFLVFYVLICLIDYIFLNSCIYLFVFVFMYNCSAPCFPCLFAFH